MLDERRKLVEAYTRARYSVEGSIASMGRYINAFDNLRAYDAEHPEEVEG